MLAFQDRKKYGKEKIGFSRFSMKKTKWYSGKHALRATFGNTMKSGD